LIYLDTSFVVSLYLNDRHSLEARRSIVSAPPLWFTPLHNAEWAHAISQHVFRGELSLSESQRMTARLEEHVAQRRWMPVPIPEGAFELCADLARQQGPRMALGTLDTLHVACALELRAEQFWTFDERQGKLARVAGLRS
jgi:predicted nucleic acid-binding protein